MKQRRIGMFTDRVHAIPRRWSNRQLRKFAHHFRGDIINVSAWKDEDKEGNHYRDYFVGADSYRITNFETEACGFQGTDGEIFLDLQDTLPEGLHGRFDTVFNHTTLEHVLDVQTAFDNVCRMSRDAVILVVPFLQQYHTTYGDYWRFTPTLLEKLVAKNGLSLHYMDFNNQRSASVYIFAIALRNPEDYKGKIDRHFSVVDRAARSNEPYIGCNAIPNQFHRMKRFAESCIKHPFGLRRSA